MYLMLPLNTFPTLQMVCAPSCAGGLPSTWLGAPTLINFNASYNLLTGGASPWADGPSRACSATCTAFSMQQGIF